MKKKLPIRFFAVAIICLAIVIYIFPRVLKLFESSYILEYGELTVTDEAEIFFVRDENLYVAGQGGTANYYIEDGALVRTGTTILGCEGQSAEEPDDKYAKIAKNAGDKAVTTDSFVVPEVGIVSYYGDGLEGTLTPETMEDFTYDEYKELTKVNVVDLKRDKINKGEATYRVIDHTMWYMVCYVDEGSIKRFDDRQVVKVKIEDEEIDAQVYSIRKKDGKLRVILETDAYYKDFSKRRSAEGSIITHEERGLLVDNNSIGEEKGVQGVYVRGRSGEFFFVPIRVYLTDGKSSLVVDGSYYDEEGQLIETVEIYDEVLKKPKKS